MKRIEFTRATKEQADDRAQDLCEAVGELYNLPEGKRCNLPLGKGRQYDHILACSNGGDNSLSNCAVICVFCHAFKTTKIDIPRAAKIQRVRRKHREIKKAKYKWPKRKFGT